MNIARNNYNLIPISDTPDADKPLSFQVWKNSYEVIIPEQAYSQYNDYLVNWYKNKSAISEDLSNQIKINFLNLLKQIQIYFTEEEKESWYSGINIDNEKEVLLAIPYFARKLKNISLYYLRLREQIKRSKLKYNLTGSHKGTIKQIQDIILQQYTKKQDGVVTLPSSLWSHIPQLSSIKNNIVIEIEELYDTTSYFDRSVNLPTSAYFLVEDETEKYFSTKGINLSGIDWIYRLGTFTLSALNNSSLQGTTDPSLSSLYFDLAQKYLGSDFYSSLVVESSAKKDFYNINIQPGNNFFYYPAGPYKVNVTGLPRYKPVPLSSTSLQTLGTPGSSIDLADTIFVKTKNGIEGAWFRKKMVDVIEANMKATIEGNESTIFRFPYPGYGISAEDIDWTGYSLVTDPRYFYLDEKTKKGIEEIYWNTSFNLSGIDPLPLNSTTLVENGANSSKDYNTADKIRIWPTPPQYSNTSYSGTVNESWLYKFTDTNISIKNNSNNTVVWPYYKINPRPDLVLPPLPNGICLPENLTDLSIPFAVASDRLSSADVIYKINNINDPKEAGVECAWLSGSYFYLPQKHTYGPKQNHFSAIFQPNTYTSFIWNDNTVDINLIFNKTRTHNPDCPYLTTPSTTYKDHKLCTCRLVNFAPFGHPGLNYYDNESLCDIITEDLEYTPLSSIDISMWRDSNGLDIFSSPAAAWYKTNQKIGWGSGTWFTGASATDNTFYLQRGKRYIYYRAGLKTTNNTNNLPELVIRHEITSNDKTSQVWINAVKDDRGRWVSTDVPSKMVINPNDIFIYSRAGSTFYNITGSYTAEQIIAENRGSIWSVYDYISVNHPSTFITVSYPVLLSKVLPVNNINDPYQQYPIVPLNGITRILEWRVTGPDNSVEVFSNASVASFKPTLTGLYTISMTAITAVPGTIFTPGATGCYYFSNIPPITCVPATIEVPLLSTYNIPVPGFVLQTNLRGWNYSLNRPSTLREGNVGARPLWVKSNLDKTPATNYKSVESWSPALSFIDNYNSTTLYDISNIILSGGEYLEYRRIPQTKITWDQNITIKNKVDINQWSKLETIINLDPTNTLPVNLQYSKPTETPSTLLLQNIVDNEQVEVYYNSRNFFVWAVTAEPQISETVYSSLISSVAINSTEPWNNYTNQFYPTVAFFPTLDNFQNTKQIGEYFKPKNLGLLTYVNKDFSFELQLSTLQTTDIYGAPSQKINNRGLTKENQFSPYKILGENSTWLKEPYTTGSLAGTIKKDIFRRYQKFIPYQSVYESNPQFRIGLITPQSRQTPWGGAQNTSWVDPTNRPINFTGEINVSNWTNDQILKNIDLQMYNWCSDIYGNQYGLYKKIKNISPSQQIFVPGQLWIRKNSQQTQPGYIGLQQVFDTYKNLSLIHELTGSGIYKIDIFNDTLYIETSGAILFEKINYSYEQDLLFSTVDAARGISLPIPAQNNLNREFSNQQINFTNYATPGDTWFFAKEKTVIIAISELSGNNLVPNLFSYDLGNSILKKVFTIPATEEAFNNLNIVSISRPALSYCSTKKQFLYTFTAKTTTNETLIVSIYIDKNTEYILNSIKVYQPQKDTTHPPIILSNLNINLPLSSTYTQQLTAIPSNSIFTPINFPQWATLTNSGLFTCTISSTNQSTNLQFKVTNNIGPTYSSLNISINDN